MDGGVINRLWASGSASAFAGFLERDLSQREL